jgi:hypothetical protein
MRSENEVMYVRASSIEFFFSALIVVIRDTDVPRMVKRLMVTTSLPVIELVRRCSRPDIIYFLLT